MDTTRRGDKTVGEEGDRALAGQVGEDCFEFLRPLMRRLDRKLDVRLVRTLANAVVAVVRHRNRPLALLLSELGGVIAGAEHGPAGTKRLANLIHSDRWDAWDIEEDLLGQAKGLVEEEAARVVEGRALCILDSSVLEKPESTELEGLAPVMSAKAKRLARPRPKQGKGYYKGKPQGPVAVPGFGWIAALITGWAERDERRPVALGAWHWYTKERDSNQKHEGVPYQKMAEAAEAVLSRMEAACSRDSLLYVWDRGLSGAAWLSEALDKGRAFVVRWKKGNRLRPDFALSVGDPTASASKQEQEGVLAWKLTAGLRPWGRQVVANPRNPSQPITVSYGAKEVRLLHRDDPLFLVVVRLGKATKRKRGGSEPWRLLTNQPVRTEEECWRIVVAYAARWQIEQALRYSKSELGIESVRVRGWKPRGKLLAIASLAYAFLVHLLADETAGFIPAILRWAHRTGRQANTAWKSLYRLRAALANLWNRHTPSFQGAP